MSMLALAKIYLWKIKNQIEKPITESIILKWPSMIEENRQLVTDEPVEFEK